MHSVTCSGYGLDRGSFQAEKRSLHFAGAFLSGHGKFREYSDLIVAGINRITSIRISFEVLLLASLQGNLEAKN